MNEILNKYKHFDNFLKTQILIIAIISFNWALIIPLITKLQGLLWTTSIISAYLILQKCSAFIYPYFQSTKINKAYFIMIMLDIVYTISLGLYFIDTTIFLYTEAVLMLLYGIVMNVFGINYDTYIMRAYDNETFKTLQYMERISMALAGIFGFFIVIILDILTQDMNKIVITFMFISIIVIIAQLLNYKKYWIDLDE